MRRIIILIALSFILAGCFDYQELSDINIVNGIGVDYKDGEYIVNLEMIKSTNNNTSSVISTNVIEGKDEVFANAFNKAIKNSGKKVYLKHVSLLLLSEDLAHNGINDVFDYMIRDVKINTTFYTIVSKDPKKILDTKLDNDSIGNLIVDTITFNVEADTLDNIDIMVSNLLGERKDIALPYVVLKDKNVSILELAYFSKSKMVDKIDSKIYNFLLLKSTNIDFLNDGNILNIYNKKIDYEVKKDKITINISGLAKVKKVNHDVNLKDKKYYKILENEINEVIEKEVNEFMEKTLSNDADLIGLKDKYYKKFNKDINNIDYEVNSSITLNKNGAIYEVIHD